MWRPTTLGEVIAERSFVLTKNGRKNGTVRVRFGRPVRGPDTDRREPWWCPFDVRGLGLDGLHPVAGIDALQAIVLALDFVTRVLPEQAARRGLRVEWLGETVRIDLARHSLAARTDEVLAALFMALRDTASLLASTAGADRRVTRSLSALMQKAHGMKKAKPVARPRRRKRAARQLVAADKARYR